MAKEKDTVKSVNIILIILVVILAIYISYMKYQDWQNNKLIGAYNQGVNDANLATYNRIIQELNTYGSVGFTFLDSMNRTQTIRLVPQQQETSAG